MTARTGMHSGTPFAQANGSSFARASFNFILFVIGAVFAVSIFAFSAVLSLDLIFALLIGILLAVIIALRGLICSPQTIRPGLSAA